ncbi:MAG TPA: L-threonylcarbamoyladenylate synthase [Thermoanaerobaculia bacterium]|nr:L-threonylcarbamoyladenylate synthase [Thermoanaerobaculia bacterium]
MAITLQADGDPGSETIERLVATLRGGEVAILPTDTIYGLHALATDESAVERLFEAKRRPRTQPLAVLCSDLDQIRALGVEADEPLLDALGRIWPAPLTAILRLARPIPASAGRDSIAVRIPDLPWLRELTAIAGPLASSSANLSGERAVYSTTELPKELLDSVAVVLDCGPLVAKSSTLVDFTTPRPTVIRAGEFLFTQKLWKTMWKTL